MDEKLRKQFAIEQACRRRRHLLHRSPDMKSIPKFCPSLITYITSISYQIKQGKIIKSWNVKFFFFFISHKRHKCIHQTHFCTCSDHFVSTNGAYWMGIICHKLLPCCWQHNFTHANLSVCLQQAPDSTSALNGTYTWMEHVLVIDQFILILCLTLIVLIRKCKHDSS